MAKKRIVMAIGHKDMGTNLPEQKEAVKRTAKVIADFIQDGWQVAIVHSNAPQVGMIHLKPPSTAFTWFPLASSSLASSSLITRPTTFTGV